ncbi:DedA family protein [Gordonia sp. CPCC 205333]|uniref:DedA family protein n=1 Tax=Gordonia sp. CPCC 205333 TaxID=3140790 RepID=UPI003AF3D50A
MNPFEINDFLATGGLIALCVLIFIETGLLVGFIFPGDSVLFTAGVLIASPDPFTPLWLACVLVSVSAALGDQCGYFIGRRLGRGMLQGRLMRLIGPEPLEKTHRYFERYGPLTVFFARFIGVVRTLTPPVAGFTGMAHRTFTLFSALGSFTWAGGIILLGYFLGQVALIRDHLDVLILASVGTIVIPVAFHLIRRWRALRREAHAASLELADRPAEVVGDDRG